MRSYCIYISLLLVTFPSNAIELSPTTKNILKEALKVGDHTTIDALYKSIVTGDTPQFASLINNTPNYFEQLASQYTHPTSIAITIDNNATIRDLAMFDYLTDEAIIKTIEYFLETHRTKPFIPNLQLVECYKGLMSLHLAETEESEKDAQEPFTQEDLRKAILAIIYYSNVYALRNALSPQDQGSNTTIALYSSLLRMAAVLRKDIIMQELSQHTPSNTIIKTTLKDVLTTGHQFFQKLYCKNIPH